MNINLSRMIRKVKTQRRTAVDGRELASLMLRSIEKKSMDVVLILTQDTVIRFSRGKKDCPKVAYNSVVEQNPKLYEKVMVRENALSLLDSIISELGAEYCNSSYNTMIHELSGTQVKRSKTLLLEGGEVQGLAKFKIVENYFLDGVDVE